MTSFMSEALRLKQSLKDVIIDCMEADVRMTGEISLRWFNDICYSYDIDSDRDDIFDFIQESDSSRSGIVSYFSLASLICKTNLNRRGRNDDYRGREENLYSRSNGDRRSKKNSDDDRLLSRRGNPQRNSTTRFQDDDFEEQNVSARRPPSNLERQTSRSNIQQPETQTRLTPSDIVQQINTVIADRVGSSHVAFKKWKGLNNKVSAESLHEGLLQDGNVNISIQDLKKVVTNDMSLTDFAKMLSSQSFGSNGNSGNTPFGQSRKMTADEETICEVARQINTPGWESIIFKSPGNDEMVKGLQRIGVEVDSNKLRIITAKLGKTGLIDAIKQRIE